MSREGLTNKVKLEKTHEVGERARWRTSEGRVFQAEGTATAKS